MAADLVTKLWLDTKGFDGNIDKAISHLYKLKREGEKGSQGIGSLQKSFEGAGAMVSKFAGALGAAVTIQQTFEKTMRSNQTTSDIFDNNINACKESVDRFFYSLGTGDWNAFSDGLLGAYSKARDLSAMLDELADKKLSLNLIRSEDLRDIEKWEQIAKDTNNSYEDRISAAQNMQGVVHHLNKKLGETKQLQMDILNKDYANKSGLNFNEEDIQYFASNTNFDGGLTSKANAAYKEYLKLQKESARLSDNAVYTKKQEDIKASQAAATRLRIFKEENGFLIKQGWLTEENDESRKNTIETLVHQLDLEREAYSLQKRADETKRAVVPDKVDPSLPSGSIMALKKEISELKKQFELATDEGTRVGLKKAIRSKEVEIEMARLRTEKMTPLKAPPLSDISFPVKGANPSDAKISRVDTSSYKDFKPISLIETDNSALDYLTAMSNLVGNLSGVTENAGAAWMQYSANIISSVGAMLPAIASLFGIEAALGIAEQSKMAFPMNLIAMAATVAGLAAAIASIPKFADGGIVGGHSFYGDKVPAMVNSGEMILNGGQQANLFRMLNGGGGGRATNVQVTGRLVAHGRDLVAVIDRQNNFNNRVR